MFKSLLILTVFILVSSCGRKNDNDLTKKKSLAERYFRGLYGCNPAVVDELAADEIAVSYPIFQKLYKQTVIRGRQSVKEFSERFCSNWKDARFTFHESIAEGDKVVLVWSFSARNVGTEQEGVEPTNHVHSWGGITLIQFDKEGKIISEIGEESEPGPKERLNFK